MAEPWNPADAAVRLLWRIGWRIGPRLSEPARHRLGRVAAEIAVRRGGGYLDQFAENLRLATGADPDADLLRAGIASYLRNLTESLAMSRWPPAEIVSRVSTRGEDALRRAADSRGAVVALPHSGNWDLAGAWACLTGMPVTTVAEELSMPEYEAFLAFRTGLGMEVISHRDPAALPQLIDAVRRRRVVCLVADRDLLGSGVPVQWNGHPVTMPAGPAVVARRSGAALFPMVSTFTPTGVLLDIGPEIDHAPGRTGLERMVQGQADWFADRIRRTPQDWHLMQPFFDRPERR